MEQTSDTRTQLRADLESLRIDRGGAPPRRRRRWLWILVGVALIAIAGTLVARVVRRRTPEVRVASVTKTAPGAQSAVAILSGSGYVVTGERYISIGVRVAGRIDRYFVEEGQQVRAGDPLVQLDDRDYRALTARAEAALRVGRANIALADSELERGRSLRRQAVISQQEFDVLQNKADVARATEAQINAELTQAKVNLEYTTLRAPSDGVVLAKLKEVGEIAVPGGFAGSGDLIRLANLTDMRAEVDVNESDLMRVRMGQPAEVTPDAYPDARYAAEVVKMYPQVDRQKGTLKIEVRVREPDSRLLPDMSVRVSFLEVLPPDQGQQPTALVPAAAIRRDGAEQTFVWTVTDGHVRRVSVTTAGQAGDQVRISGGLATDAPVVISDDKDLSDGAAVKVVGG